MAKTLTIYEHNCNRCRQTFTSRLRNPEACGKCRSRYWNKPRVRAPKTPKKAIA